MNKSAALKITIYRILDAAKQDKSLNNNKTDNRKANYSYYFDAHLYLQCSSLSYFLSHAAAEIRLENVKINRKITCPDCESECVFVK